MENWEILGFIIWKIYSIICLWLMKYYNEGIEAVSFLVAQLLALYTGSDII